MPVLDVLVGMTVLGPNGPLGEVVGRDRWPAAGGGEPWVQLTLRRPAAGGLVVAGYHPAVEVEADAPGAPVAAVPEEKEGTP
jgi:hypothetical protein